MYLLAEQDRVAHKIYIHSSLKLAEAFPTHMGIVALCISTRTVLYKLGTQHVPSQTMAVYIDNDRHACNIQVLTTPLALRHVTVLYKLDKSFLHNWPTLLRQVPTRHSHHVSFAVRQFPFLCCHLSLNCNARTLGDGVFQLDKLLESRPLFLELERLLVYSFLCNNNCFSFLFLRHLDHNRRPWQKQVETGHGAELSLKQKKDIS